jgi:ankyrin repeat protein
VAELLAAGANPDLGDSGLDCMTPLHVVAWQGNVEAVRLTNLYLSIHLSIYPYPSIYPSI